MDTCQSMSGSTTHGAPSSRRHCGTVVFLSWSEPNGANKRKQKKLIGFMAPRIHSLCDAVSSSADARAAGRGGGGARACMPPAALAPPMRPGRSTGCVRSRRGFRVNTTFSRTLRPLHVDVGGGSRVCCGRGRCRKIQVGRARKLDNLLPESCTPRGEM